MDCFTRTIHHKFPHHQYFLVDTTPGGRSLVSCAVHPPPSTVRPLVRDPLVLIGWPLPLRYLAWAGACYWHGVSGFMFNSPSPSSCLSPRVTLYLSSRGIGRDQNQARLTTPGLKPTPAWLGDWMRWRRAMKKKLVFSTAAAPEHEPRRVL